MRGHPADDAVVAGAQEPLDDEIQAERRARCQDDMGRRLRKMEQPRKRLAQGQRLQPGLLRAAVDGAIDRRAHTVEILLHAVADPGRLRERRRGVVKIYKFCHILSFDDLSSVFSCRFVSQSVSQKRFQTLFVLCLLFILQTQMFVQKRDHIVVRHKRDRLFHSFGVES